MSQGLGLMDIVPASEDVKIDETQSLKLTGISFEDIVTLMKRFPEAQAWALGGKLDPARLVQVAPEAVAAVIAASCGFIGDEKAEKRARAIAVETQLDCIEAIVRITFRSGFGPFVERIAGVAGLARAVSESSGKAPATNSQPSSSNSQPSGVVPTPSGS